MLKEIEGLDLVGFDNRDPEIFKALDIFAAFFKYAEFEVDFDITNTTDLWFLRKTETIELLFLFVIADVVMVSIQI